MRIGLIVDGQSEVGALPLLSAKLQEDTGHTVIGPVLATVHPNARVGRIVSVVIERVETLMLRNVDQIVLLLDREDRSECPGQIAARLQGEIQPHVSIPFDVVIKDRMFENWLIADIEALRSMQERFDVSSANVRSVVPNRADSVKADELLKACARRRAYHKVKDACRILEHADVLRMASNSRSFRRFLRCIERPDYITLSRAPIS